MLLLQRPHDCRHPHVPAAPHVVEHGVLLPHFVGEGQVVSGGIVGLVQGKGVGDGDLGGGYL